MNKSPLRILIKRTNSDGELEFEEQNGNKVITYTQKEIKETMNEANRQAQLNKGKGNEKGVEGSNKVG